jgi:hypothetical protein
MDNRYCRLALYGRVPVRVDMSGLFEKIAMFSILPKYIFPVYLNQNIVWVINKGIADKQPHETSCHRKPRTQLSL